MLLAAHLVLDSTAFFSFVHSSFVSSWCENIFFFVIPSVRSYVRLIGFVFGERKWRCHLFFFHNPIYSLPMSPLRERIETGRDNRKRHPASAREITLHTWFSDETVHANRLFLLTLLIESEPHVSGDGSFREWNFSPAGPRSGGFILGLYQLLIWRRPVE